MAIRAKNAHRAARLSCTPELNEAHFRQYLVHTMCWETLVRAVSVVTGVLAACGYHRAIIGGTQGFKTPPWSSDTEKEGAGV